MGPNTGFRGYVESISHRGLLGLLSKTQSELLDFFEDLVWDTCESEQVREALNYPTYVQYTFQVNNHHQDHFIDSYDRLSYSYVPPILFDYCGSSDHDVYNCPYHDYVDATCASLTKTIK